MNKNGAINKAHKELRVLIDNTNRDGIINKISDNIFFSFSKCIK